jgi:Tetratricopeptide repeat
MKLNDISAAEISLRRALEIAPERHEARCVLGSVLGDQHRYAEAAECLREVLRQQSSLEKQQKPSPNSAYWVAMTNLARYLDELDQTDASIDLYQQAIREDPESALIHTNFGYVLLKHGRYVEGWVEHEWRWKAPGFPSKQRDFNRPLWKGTPLAGAKILLYWEQGYGDTLQFIRYVPLVAERGGRVILEVQPSLRKLLSQLPGVEQFIAEGDPLPEFTWHCPLMSLPLAFGTTAETIPPAPYLTVPQEDIKAAKAEWPADGLRVGLAWSGSPKHPLNANRSMSLRHLLPLGEVPGTTFYSLQTGDGAKQIEEVSSSFRISDVCSQDVGFIKTAPFVAGLDLVITIDTVIAHLAGALGIPVWILLAHNRADWRWHDKRSDSPWYPSVRLFRQAKPGDWSEVIERVKDELQHLSNKGHQNGMQ